MLTLPDCRAKLYAFKNASAASFGISRIGIFGSVARQENTENSDIDIVVELEKPSLELMYRLKTTLGGIFGCEVDLIRLRNSLNPLLKGNIEKDVVYV